MKGFWNMLWGTEPKETKEKSSNTVSKGKVKKEHSWNSWSVAAPSTGPMTGTPEQIEKDYFWSGGLTHDEANPYDYMDMSTVEEAMSRRQR